MKRNYLHLLIGLMIFTGVSMIALAAMAQPGLPYVPPPLPVLTWKMIAAHLHLTEIYGSLITLMGTSRIWVKPFNAWIQSWMSALAAQHTDSINSDFNRALLRFFNWLPYQIVQFTLDYVLSLKLATAASYAAAVTQANKPTMTQSVYANGAVKPASPVAAAPRSFAPATAPSTQPQ